MDKGLESPFIDFGSQIINYLPSLLAGIILLLVGWFIGWIAKRITIQILVILRFERLFLRLQWRRALSKADIRYAVFNLLGNFVFFIVFLILGIGWIIAGRVSNSVYNALLKEDVPHFSIISRFVKFVSLLFFASMALVEIDIATQIVVIGFTTIMISLGIILITIILLSGKSFIGDFMNTVGKKKD